MLAYCCFINYVINIHLDFSFPRGDTVWHLPRPRLGSYRESAEKLEYFTFAPLRCKAKV